MGGKLDEIQSVIAASTAENNNPSKSLITLDDKESIVKTELNDNQIKAITRLKTVAELLDNRIILWFIETFLHAQISRNRQSRREFIASNQSFITHEERTASMGGFFSEKV